MGLFSAIFPLKKEKVYERISQLPAETLTEIMLKAFALPTPSQVTTGYEPSPNHLTNWDENQDLRRAISTISNYYNTLGVFRQNFDKNLNDRLAENAYFALVEKALQDYIACLDFRVTDKNNEHVEKAEWFLKHPNPQETWSDLIRAIIPDLVRYDAAVWVKTFNRSGYLVELKAYLGTEFWPEIDRDIMYIDYPKEYPIPDQVGYLSRGYVRRWWQRSRTGLYVSFEPEELVYFSMYPQSDDVYGLDYIKVLKYHLQYLIDSTRAAGMTFKNGVVPSIVWKHPQVMDTKQLTQRLKEVKTANQGAANFGSVLHLVRDEEIDTLAHTLHDMEWLEGQRFIAQLVWAMWGFQPSEFAGESVNRATAYVGRNITKAKVLYPMMKFIEDRINDEVLPYLRDYSKHWKFAFIRDIDLDDEMKIAEINATKANTANILWTMGIQAPCAMKIAGFGDDARTADFEYFDHVQMARLKESATMMGGGPMKDDHGEPKKFGDTQLSRPESYTGEARDIKFGDAEERNAGIKKSQSEIILKRGDVHITFHPSGPSIISSRDEESKEIATNIRKELRKAARYHRPMMSEPEIWEPIIRRYANKFSLEVIINGN